MTSKDSQTFILRVKLNSSNFFEHSNFHIFAVLLSGSGGIGRRARLRI